MAIKTQVIQEGRCIRCGQAVTRETGGCWSDFFGRSRCRADYDDGECDVREWSSRQVKLPDPLPAMEVVLYGTDDAGQPAVLVRQVIPQGGRWLEMFPEPVNVTSLEIRLDGPG